MSENGLMDGRLAAWKAVVAEQAARIAELEKVLKPFADCAKYLPDPNQDFPNDVVALDMGDGRIWTLQDWSFFDARTTLEASERGGGE